MIRKVISGGQTGVDRAGLDAVLQAGIPIGGFVPRVESPQMLLFLQRIR